MAIKKISYDVNQKGKKLLYKVPKLKVIPQILLRRVRAPPQELGMKKLWYGRGVGCGYKIFSDRILPKKNFLFG